MTMSSFMPSVSIFVEIVSDFGEGGGVCSYAERRLFGRGTELSRVGDGGASFGEAEDSESSCDRFVRLGGGGETSDGSGSFVAGGDRWEREVLGS